MDNEVREALQLSEDDVRRLGGFYPSTDMNSAMWCLNYMRSVFFPHMGLQSMWDQDGKFWTLWIHVRPIMEWSPFVSQEKTLELAICKSIVAEMKQLLFVSCPDCGNPECQGQCSEPPYQVC